MAFHLSPQVFFNDGYLLTREQERKIGRISIERHSLLANKYCYSSMYGAEEEAIYAYARFKMDGGILQVITVIEIF